MAASQAIVVVIVACFLGIAEALEALESLPLSTQTCRLAGVALISVMMVLLQSKGQSNESSETTDKPTESEKRQWWYRDMTGKVHGPFTATEMQQWYKEGYMSASLMIKFADMASFSPLAILFPEQSVPFVSAPQVPTQTKESSSDDEPPAWSSDDEQAVIRKWRIRRRAQYKDTVCDMAAVVAAH